jgi:Uncharacterized conserved protein (DUF2203)
MKPRKKKSERMRALRLWSWSEVTKAAPYLRSVIGSLREHWLEVLAAQRRLDKSTQQKSPLSRAQMIEHEARKDERQRAQDKFDDALEELNRVEVFLLDPVQGMALIPFRKEDDLAWYFFDHFSADGVIGWRYHHDPIEECRPLSLLTEVVVNGSPAK